MIPESDLNELRDACIDYAYVNNFPSQRWHLVCLLEAIRQKNGIVYDEVKMQEQVDALIDYLRTLEGGSI